MYTAPVELSSMKSLCKDEKNSEVSHMGENQKFDQYDGKAEL